MPLPAPVTTTLAPSSDLDNLLIRAILRSPPVRDRMSRAESRTVRLSAGHAGK
jgi:hypothetical protein